MHEMTLAFNLIKIIETQAAQHQPKKISTVWVEIGALAGIEIHALEFSFNIANKNTIANNAKLNIIKKPGEAWCKICEQAMIINRLGEACPDCQNYQYSIKTGQQFLLKKLEMI